MHSLSAIDLNLVVALHALLEESSVTGAARRAGVSQPAMSHSLARLRKHFGDPLLIRSGRRMVPTARAVSLLAEVRRSVAGLERLWAQSEVDPASLRTDVRLITDDHVGTTLLPAIVAHISTEAPGVGIDVLPRGHPGRKAMLRAGRADLALGHFSEAGMDLVRQQLTEDPWMGVARPGHPLLVSLDPVAWAAVRHVIVSPTGGRRGVVDAALEAHGLRREVALAVPHFATALAVVAATDHVLTTPQSMARASGMAVFAPPLPLPPHGVAMLWHPRTQHDPVQQWLRTLVARVAASGAGR